MMKVFIGGSRRVSRLDERVKGRLDEIIRKQLPVIIGDANGADRAVQDYFHQRAYEQVEVFCTEGRCRNNVGNWRIRPVPAPAGGKHDFEYYAAKDRLMAEEGSIGFMLWDGKSRGTLANVLRLMEQGKKVVVYLAPSKQFTTLRNMSDWVQFNRNGHLGIVHSEALVDPQRRGSREYGFF
ncbi:MAG TPA: hypothetical protein VKO18_01915 [Terriglobia bacterium]|nr:hypothetical protein [Terriglobia bacterium]